MIFEGKAADEAEAQRLVESGEIKIWKAEEVISEVRAGMGHSIARAKREEMAASGRKLVDIEVALVGLARDPDPDWIDGSDSNAETRHYRKFRLASSIRPRNLGMVGIEDGT